MNIDLRLATRLTEATLEEMKIYKNRAKKKNFQQIYICIFCTCSADKFQMEMKIPSVTGKQVYRMNIQTKSTEE